MADLYTQIVNAPVANAVASTLGLPVPTPLERYSPGDPVLAGKALVGGAPGGELGEAILRVLAHAEIDTATETEDGLRQAAADADLDASVWNADAPAGEKFKALIFDATGIEDSEQLKSLHRFFHPAIRTVGAHGRVIVIGRPPETLASPRTHTAQRALEGFTRSLGKEMRAGGTVQLVYVEKGAEGLIDSTLRFLLSPKSAYVDGQVIRVGKGPKTAAKFDWEQPLAGKVALVTGASRGIGASIASVLARDGAHVVGLDIPPLADDLRSVTAELGGSAIVADVTDDATPKQIVDELTKAHGGVDIVIHNAGVTRDKTIAGMDDKRWDLTLDINLSSQERIDDALLEAGTINKGGRIVCLSSMNGIAGAGGQTNYASSKAGVIGRVTSMADTFAKAGATINAVAPGFIETQMTAAMPVPIREAGRRMSSLSQGGLPVDVAETIAWFASPASGGVNGNTLRVCGQNLLGA